MFLQSARQNRQPNLRQISFVLLLRVQLNPLALAIETLTPATQGYFPFPSTLKMVFLNVGADPGFGQVGRGSGKVLMPKVADLVESHEWSEPLAVRVIGH